MLNAMVSVSKTALRRICKGRAPISGSLQSRHISLLNYRPTTNRTNKIVSACTPHPCRQNQRALHQSKFIQTAADLKLEELKSYHSPSTAKLMMNEEDIQKLWKDKKVAKYWDANQIPFNPANGNVDFRFLKEPFLKEDHIVNTLIDNVKPGQSRLVTFEGTAGAGKTGAIFAYAQKQYVLYVDAMSPSFKLFCKLLDQTLVISKQHLPYNTRLTTDIISCMTHILWLSQALVLNSYKTQISAREWMALLGNPSEINLLMEKLGKKFLEELAASKCDREWVEQKRVEQNALLSQLTENVVFVVDNAEEALQPLDISLTNAFNSKTTFLSVLVCYSLPPQKTAIVTGSHIPDLNDCIKEGPSNDMLLHAERTKFPVMTARKSISIMTRLFPPLQGHPELQQLIANVTAGRLKLLSALANNMCKVVQANSFEELVRTAVDMLKQEVRIDVHQELNNAATRTGVPNLLKKLYAYSVISPDCLIADHYFKKLGVGLETFSFITVPKEVRKLAIGPDGTSLTRCAGICEPLYIEIFHDWMKSKQKTFAQNFETHWAQVVGSSASSSTRAQDNSFESLVGTLLMNWSKLNVKLPIISLPVINTLPNLPEWTSEIAFDAPWISYGYADECADLHDATNIVMKTNFNLPISTLIEQLQISSILCKLLKDENTADLEKNALQAIQAAGEHYAPELLMLLTKYDKALVKPNKEFGADMIGFKGDVLYSVAAYCYTAPETREEFQHLNATQHKQAEKLRSIYQQKTTQDKSVVKAQQALEAVRLVNKWKEIHLDVRMPQTNKDQSYVSEDGQCLHIIISQDNFAEITADKKDLHLYLKHKSISEYQVLKNF